MVAPACGYGRKWRERELRADGVGIALCDKWEPSGTVYMNRHDIGRPVEWEVCGHRTTAGDYAHNWCCVCIAGYPQMRLAERDTGARERSAF